MLCRHLLQREITTHGLARGRAAAVAQAYAAYHEASHVGPHSAAAYLAVSLAKSVLKRVSLHNCLRAVRVCVGSHTGQARLRHSSLLAQCPDGRCRE